MSCPLPSDFQALIVDLSAPACDQLRKLGRIAQTVSNAYGCIYNEDMTFTDEFAAKICATGCGSSASTSTDGSTTSTTTTPSATSPQNYSTPGDYVFTVPAGVTQLTVTAVAGGGSGARASAFTPANYRYAGGGSGERRIHTFAVTPGDTVDVTVGAGGGGSTGIGQSGSLSLIAHDTLTLLAIGGGGGQLGPCYSGSGGPYPGGVGGSGGSGGTGTNGNAGSNTTAFPACGNGAGGASVGLGAGAGSAGSSISNVANPGGNGYVRISW